MSGNGSTISLWNIAKNIYQGKGILGMAGVGPNRSASATKSTPKPLALQELEKEEAKKKADKALLEKNKRVNSKWNDFKSVFGFGEKLTKQEQIDVIKLTSAHKFTIQGEAGMDSFSTIE